jgi:hypothetical protein
MSSQDCFAKAASTKATCMASVRTNSTASAAPRPSESGVSHQAMLPYFCAKVELLMPNQDAVTKLVEN